MTHTYEEFDKHDIFPELDRCVAFYKNLGLSVIPFCTVGTRTIINIDSYIYSFTSGTFDSIQYTVRNGRLSDAYALLRKYYDSAIINIYSNLYLEDNVCIEKIVVEDINSWVQGKKPLPEYRIMSKYIRESPKLAPINELLYHDDRYKKIRDRCNDHTHFNQFDIFIRNDNEVTTPPPAPVLDEFRSDLRAIFLLHLAYLFFLNDHYMMSTDYLDSLEYGIEPIEDSQYWVAPFVQEIFDSVLKKDRPDLAAAITQNTGMHLS